MQAPKLKSQSRCRSEMRDGSMKPLRKVIAQFTILMLLVPSVQAGTLVLSSDFVKRSKNRATISVNFELDEHLKSPHRVLNSGDDGDVHMAGRAPEVRLPMVVEIMNAGLKDQASSVTLMDNTAAGKSIAITGAWRIWFEHPSQDDQVQGQEVDVPANSNPDHVFEIHPVTVFGDDDIADSSLVPIVGPKDNHAYEAYSANKAFAVYENLQATIKVTDTAVSITSNKVGYNYTEFLLEPAGQSKRGDVGIFVLANVYDLSDEETPVTSEPRRMVFIEHSEPAKALQNLGRGQRMHVLGIPRVNLAEVAAVSSGKTVTTSLPYEMIIVAVFPED